MTDTELIAAFESTTLPAGRFTHETHVHVAWCYLRMLPLPEALARFVAALKRYADAHGATGKYHETITVAYMLLIAARMGEARDAGWTDFASSNPDLFTREPSALARYYSPEALRSDLARHTFVMPDRLGGS